jgi:hypothetical protein
MRNESFPDTLPHSVALESVSTECQGLIPGLLCECVGRAHFGVEEVGKQLAL